VHDLEKDSVKSVDDLIEYAKIFLKGNIVERDVTKAI
jgi:hypothetical protein